MSWVKEALAGLQQGEEVRVRPQGGSMRGKFESGQQVTISPAGFQDVTVGDVIFVEWKGNYLLHLAVEIDESRILIGNNLGKINGWIEAEAVLGRVIEIGEN